MGLLAVLLGTALVVDIVRADNRLSTVASAEALVLRSFTGGGE